MGRSRASARAHQSFNNLQAEVTTQNRGAHGHARKGREMMTLNEAKAYAEAVDTLGKITNWEAWRDAEAAFIRAGKCINCGGALLPWQPGNVDEYAGHECPTCGEFYKWGEQPEYDTGPTGHGELCFSDADPGL